MAERDTALGVQSNGAAVEMAGAAPSIASPSAHSTAPSPPPPSAASPSPSPPPSDSLHVRPPPPANLPPPLPSGGMPPLTAAQATIAAPPRPLAVTSDQKELVQAILHADIDALYTRFNKTDWNFSTHVVGRTNPQTPLGLLLRPELNYGNLSRMSRLEQYKLVQHVLTLPEGCTPRLDSLDQKPGPFRQTMSSSVIQAVYQGRVDLIELLYETAQDRARQGTGVAFDLREKFFPSKITLLHMAAHDGRMEMSKWIVNKWLEEAERDPGSTVSKEFFADVLDGGGQTPLFWTFARGSVSVELARYFVEECGCDFFKVFKLKSNPGSSIQPYASPFSLAIQLAPNFVEEQLQKKTENCGTRFQFQVMKNDFTGITLTGDQITSIQDQVDRLNAEHADSRERLEGKAFLASATNQIKEFVRLQKERRHERHALPPPAAVGGGTGAAAVGQQGPTHTSDPTTTTTITSSPILNVHELRFVSQEPQGGRPVKDRWDGFYYDSIPRSAVELMILHSRRRLLLQPIMIEIQDRLWKHLKLRYVMMLTCYVIFGLLYSINTGIWPRTSQLLGSNIQHPFEPQTPQTTWRGLYFTCNITCILLAIGLLLFHLQSIYQGVNISWRGQGFIHFVKTLRDNFQAAFRSGSSQLDLIIMVTFAIVQALQWSLVCHVPQYSQLCSFDEGIVGPLNEDRLGALAWWSAFLHLLLGMKILELVSVFEFAGPLLSTLIGMVRDVGKFIVLFGIGYCAFTCAVWIVLRDVYPENVPSGLNGPGSLVSLNGGDPIEPSFTYTDAMVHVVLWIFVSFDFEIYEHVTLVGSASLGRILFLTFLLIMVLIMLNLMIAMFSNTYADVVKDGKGEWHIRYSSVLCQLLRMAGDSDLVNNYVLEMGVDNNCGIDRVSTNVDFDGEGVGGGGGGGGESRSDNWAETIQTHFQMLHAGVSKIRSEVKDLRTTVRQVQTEHHRLERATLNATAAAATAATPQPRTPNNNRNETNRQA